MRLDVYSNKLGRAGGACVGIQRIQDVRGVKIMHEDGVVSFECSDGSVNAALCLMDSSVTR